MLVIKFVILGIIILVFILLIIFDNINIEKLWLIVNINFDIENKINFIYIINFFFNLLVSVLLNGDIIIWDNVKVVISNFKLLLVNFKFFK